MQKVITFCLLESYIRRKVGIEDNDMKIINKDIDRGKPFDWGQIEQAEILSKSMDIDYDVISTEDIRFRIILLMKLQHVSVFGILTMKLLCLSFIVC